MSHASARAALLLALAGFCSLSVGDAVVKSMAGAWPAPAVSALRYGFGAAALAGYVAWRFGRAGFVMPRPGLQLGRGAAVALATLCFFMGVMAMPLADATAVQFTSPIITALLAPFVLGERTRPATWLATLLAFSGVLVVLRPNLLALGPVALFPLGAAFGMSILVMLNRKAAGVASPVAMQFLAAMMASPILILATLLLAQTGEPQFQVPEPPLSVLVKCLIVAFTATVAHMLIYIATVRASAAVVAPMTYVQLIVAAGLWLWRSQKPKDVPEMPD